MFVTLQERSKVIDYNGEATLVTLQSLKCETGKAMTMLAQKTLRLLDKFGNSSEGKRSRNEAVPSNSLSAEINHLIEETLLQINEGWTPGALEWMKRTRLSEFEQMVALEEEINRFALSRDMDGLNEALKNYDELMVGMARIFKTQRGETGN